MQDGNNPNDVNNGTLPNTQPVNYQAPPQTPGPMPNQPYQPNPAGPSPNPNLGKPSIAPAPPDNGGFDKQKKIVIIVASAIVLLLIIVTVSVLVLGGKEPIQTSEEPVISPELSKIEVINKLDDKFGSNKLKEEDMGFQKGNPEKPNLYASFDNSLSYFVDDEPEDWRFYKLDNVFSYKDINGSVSGSFAECDKFLQNNQDKSVTAVNILKDNGFSYKQPVSQGGRNTFYSQMPECYQGGMYVSKDYICSTRFDAVVLTDNNDGTSEVVPGIGVACSSSESLKDSIEKAKVSKQIAIDTGLASEGMISVPEYVKDSKVAGYKIAEVVYPSSNGWYYKKGDYPWVAVASRICTDVDTNTDAKLAFRGEQCSDGQGGTKLIP